MLNPVCVECTETMFCKENGVKVIDPGGRVWSADLWECKNCGKQVTKGYGNEPIVMSNEEGFGEYIRLCINNPKETVIDLR